MHKLLTLMVAGGLLVSISFAEGPKPDSTKPAAVKPAVTPDKDFAVNVEKIPFQTISGDTTNLAAYAGKVVLIVNVASQCGHTPQYEGLEKLYETYKDSGLVILGFPANNFGEQEPGTNAEILKFCQTTYNVKFPMMSKVSVLGADKHPLFVELTEKSVLPGDIKWNFSKFLLDRKGNLVARFEPKVEPTDTAFIATVASILKS